MNREIYGASFSLGRNALPEIKEAIQHTIDNPTHDSFVQARFPNDLNPKQSVEWRCRTCEGTDDG